MIAVRAENITAKATASACKAELEAVEEARRQHWGVVEALEAELTASKETESRLHTKLAAVSNQI